MNDWSKIKRHWSVIIQKYTIMLNFCCDGGEFSGSKYRAKNSTESVRLLISLLDLTLFLPLDDLLLFLFDLFFLCFTEVLLLLLLDSTLESRIFSVFDLGFFFFFTLDFFRLGGVCFCFF